MRRFRTFDARGGSHDSRTDRAASGRHVAGVDSLIIFWRNFCDES